MSFGVHPFILIALVGVLLALSTLIFACRARSAIVTVTLLVLALVFIAPAGYVFLAFHPELVDGRFRAYKRFYSDIQVGMTREQVLATMELFYPTDGPRKRPTIMNDTPEALGFFMNPESSREPNCEGIFLTLENGRVTKKDYSRD
jgi:hypothetical protein